jgi:hypothetical protein
VQSGCKYVYLQLTFVEPQIAALKALIERIDPQLAFRIYFREWHQHPDAPRAANARACSRPRPPPVTIATFPLNSMAMLESAPSFAPLARPCRGS